MGYGFIQKSAKLQGTTVASTTLTFAAPGQGKYNCINAVAVEVNAAALLTIESPSGTVLFQVNISAGAGFEKTWEECEPIRGAENSALLVKLSAGTTYSINASGFVTP